MAQDATLKRKSIVSTLSLFFQSGYSAVLGFAANVVLTIYLSPEIFGIYITVLSIIAFLNYFSDIGLAASLIQRNDISDEDVSTAFTIQQGIIVSLIIIGFLLTDPILRFYELGFDGRILYWALLASFFISSLKTIPSVFLERSVRFHKIVLVQVIENTCFYVVVAVLAIKGFGLLSFAYGVLIRAVTGLVVMYSISFWMPRVGISRKSAKHLLSYGVPFQSMSFLALFKDELVNLFLGKIVGFQVLGYIGWAKRWAESMLRIIMDNISRVVFPIFSRIQHDHEKQRNVIQKIIRYQSMILIPASLGMIVLMPLIVDILPKYEKWRPALPIFYIFVFSGLLSSYSTPFINFFNGIGKVKISLTFMLAWTVLTWLLIIPLTRMFGMYGFPLTVLMLSLSCVIVILKARSLIPFDFLGSMLRYVVSGAVMAVMLFLVKAGTLHMGVVSAVIMIVVGAVSYYAALLLIFKENLITELYNEFKSS